MADRLPVRKYVKVWVMRRKNNPRKGGKPPTVSYTLQWVIYGRKAVQSLGRGATLAYAKRMAAEKEKELNTEAPSDVLDPITWSAFEKKYLETFYPGYDLPPKERKAATAGWGKSFASMRSERLALGNFGRLVKADWIHEITTADRERFVTERLAEVPSAASVDADLRVLRAVFNVAEEWKHRPENSNPFAGRGRATVGSKRRRVKERARGKRQEHHTFEEVRAVLKKANEEAIDWNKRRLRALVYFVAYTGCRFNEAVHLEWHEVDLEQGIAWLHHKAETDLKTEDSAAPFGLPDRLIEVLKEWQKEATCSWVFPNNAGKPWKSSAPGFKPLDQFKELAERAGVKGTTFKKLRHSLSTLGKGHFGLTAEQVRAQLRHTTEETQKHYTHDDLANLRNAAKKIDFE